MPKAVLPIPAELDDAWSQLRNQIMGNPNSVMNDTNDWIGWLLEGVNEALWPRSPAEAGAYGAMGLAPAAITAIPKPFRSEWLDRVGKYAPSFPKTTTGAEILEQLEGRGVLPKGYGKYYSPKSEPIYGPDFLNPLHSDNLRIGPSPNHPRGYYAVLDAEGNNVTNRVIPGVEAGIFPETLQLELERYAKYRNPSDVIMANTMPEQLSRDRLVPYLEENWVNPRIDVRSRSGKIYARDRDVLTSDKLRELGYNEKQIVELLQDPNSVFEILEGLSPRHSGSQTIFNDLADDYFELLLKPRRGLEIPTPEKLALGGHWNDPSVMAHVRGETVGPRAIVQEVQSDWNRIKQLKDLYEKQEPFYYPGGDQWLPELAHFLGVKNPRDVRGTLPGYHIKTGISEAMHFDTMKEATAKLQELSAILGDVPPLPPEFAKAWPEVGAKAALSYAARNPDLQRISFVDDLIAAVSRNLDPAKTQGIYGARLSQFLRKYARTHGGEYQVEPLGTNLHPQIVRDIPFESFDQLAKIAPGESVLHTIGLGDWDSPFRRFLRSQQPLAVAPTVPLGMDLFMGDGIDDL